MKETKNTFGYSEREYKLFNKHSINYLIMFSLLYCCMYCTRTNLSNVSAVLIEDLNWSKADLGILTSTLFWTYGIGQLINGRLCEIVGPRKFLFIGALISIVCNILFSFQTNIVIMSLLWGINGFVQSMSWPSGMSMLSKWWPGDRRGFATGFALAFSGLGQVITTLSVVLSLAILPNMSWRSSFIVPSIFPLIMIVLFMLFVKPYPKSIGLEEYKEENPEKARKEEELKKIISEKGKWYPYKHLISNKKFIIWMVVAFLQGLIRYGLVSWIPLYYVEKFEVSVTSGLLQSLALPVSMGIGTFIVPTLTDKYCPNNRLAAAAVSEIIAAGCIAGFAFLNPTITYQLVLIEVLLFVAGFFIYAVTGCVWAFATDIGGRLFSGTSAGMLNFAQYMGAAIQAILYGFLVDYIGWSMVFVSVACFCLFVASVGIINTVRQ